MKVASSSLVASKSGWDIEVYWLLSQWEWCPAVYPELIPYTVENSLPVFSISAVTLSDFSAHHCVVMLCTNTNISNFD